MFERLHYSHMMLIKAHHGRPSVASVPTIDTFTWLSSGFQKGQCGENFFCYHGLGAGVGALLVHGRDH